MTIQDEMALAAEEAANPEVNQPVNAESSEADKNKIGLWSKKIKEAKSHWEDDFERMRDDMRFARGLQWEDQEDLDDPRYVANLVQRHLRTREAALYAKNPRAVANKRETLDFAIWDGEQASIMQAQQLVTGVQEVAQALMQQGPEGMLQAQQIMQQPQVLEAQELIQDYQRGQAVRQQVNRMGDTLEIVWNHQIKIQNPPFKKSMKRLVRRTLTTAVGYAKLGYVRQAEMKPEHFDRITDTTQQIANVRVLIEEADEGVDTSDHEAELNELQDALQALESTPKTFREGLDIDYPRSTSIIPDVACTELDGFLGAQWIAQEFKLTPNQIKTIYEVDVKDKFTAYDFEGERIKSEALAERGEDDKKESTLCQVWEVYDKPSGSTFTICEGFDEYLREPDAPIVRLDRFWPIFTLVFNGLEDEENVFPPSDVTLMKHQQTEHNLSRQRLREHRDAARPGHVSPNGRLEQADRSKLENRNAHDVIAINGLAENDDIRKLLQPIPVNPIDPNLYETNSVEADAYKVLGSQEAVMGGASNATATETSIAESSRLSSMGSAVDDLDDFLTELAKAASKVLLNEMAAETVQRIAGVGAVWPELSREDVADNLWLEIRAGSSGRPNKAAELQNLERVLPFLMQLPNLKPERLIEEVLTRLDDRMNVQEFIQDGLPSIMAQNRQAQMGSGLADSDPNMQGPEGGDQNAVQQGDSNMGPREPGESRNMDPNRRS